MYGNVLYKFMIEAFVAQGVSDEDARICADVLIASDLRGIESHGIGRLKYYYDRIQAACSSYRQDGNREGDGDDGVD
jgi:LDH2 family malate/lactate/ureidoglycolate dehydrogenase